MITRIGMMSRRPDLTIEQFQYHWRVRHREVVLAVKPGMRRYVQNHALLRGGYPILAHPGFDSCVETVYADQAEIDAVYARREELTAIVEDEAEFLERESLAAMMGVKIVTQNGPEEGDIVKLMTFRRVHPTKTASDLIARVEQSHQLIAGRLDVLRSEYIVADSDIQTGGGTSTFTVIDAVWGQTVEQVEQILRAPVANELADLFDGYSLGVERLIAKSIVVYDNT